MIALYDLLLGYATDETTLYWIVGVGAGLNVVLWGGGR